MAVQHKITMHFEKALTEKQSKAISKYLGDNSLIEARKYADAEEITVTAQDPEKLIEILKREKILFESEIMTVASEVPHVEGSVLNELLKQSVEEGAAFLEFEVSNGQSEFTRKSRKKVDCNKFFPPFSGTTSAVAREPGMAEPPTMIEALGEAQTNAIAEAANSAALSGYDSYDCAVGCFLVFDITFGKPWQQVGSGVTFDLEVSLEPLGVGAAPSFGFGPMWEKVVVYLPWTVTPHCVPLESHETIMSENAPSSDHISVINVSGVETEFPCPVFREKHVVTQSRSYESTGVPNQDSDTEFGKLIMEMRETLMERLGKKLAEENDLFDDCPTYCATSKVTLSLGAVNIITRSRGTNPVRTTVIGTVEGTVTKMCCS